MSLVIRVLALALIVVGLGTPRAARACSVPAPCRPLQMIPPDGSTIPANATEFVVLLGDAVVDESFAPRLRDSSGRELGFDVEIASVGAGVVRLRLLEPLLEGTEYRVEGLPASTSCGLSTAIVSRFLVGPPAPLPSGAGVLRVGEQSVRNVPFGCGEEFDEGFAELVYAADPSLAPWRPLAIAQVIVDGTPETLFSSLDAAQRVAADCDGEFARVRTVSLVVVAGAFRDDTRAVDIDLTCNAFAGCTVGSARRSRSRTPARGAALLMLAVSVFAVIRKNRR